MTINTVINDGVRVLKSVTTSTGETSAIDGMTESQLQDAFITLQALAKVIERKQAEIKASLPNVPFTGTYGEIDIDRDIKYSMDVKGALLACRERGFDITDALSINQSRIEDWAALSIVQSFRSVTSSEVKIVVRLDRAKIALIK